ncbi:hypothetical protein [Streptomyces sp. NPDC048603]|uniref:hypothetical protein n=1 Tax=Streptomyces sp. NPDC048603 TaxID=3365577 RepID=UPI00371956F2
MARIVFTLAWAGLLIAANKALDDVVWAQYLATFALGGLYAIALTRVDFLRAGKARQAAE